MFTYRYNIKTFLKTGEEKMKFRTLIFFWYFLRNPVRSTEEENDDAVEKFEDLKFKDSGVI